MYRIYIPSKRSVDEYPQVRFEPNLIAIYPSPQRSVPYRCELDLASRSRTHSVHRLVSRLYRTRVRAHVSFLLGYIVEEVNVLSLIILSSEHDFNSSIYKARSRCPFRGPFRVLFDVLFERNINVPFWSFSIVLFTKTIG